MLCNRESILKLNLWQLTKLLLVGALICFDISVDVCAFTTVSNTFPVTRGNPFSTTYSATSIKRNSDGNGSKRRRVPGRVSSTTLNVLLEVPEYFFTFTFPILGILLSISKGFARLRLEESAWEQRLAEARETRLREDRTLTELELRRKEASLEWSAYGKPRKQEEEQEREIKDNGYGNLKVAERDDGQNDIKKKRNYRMNKDEINHFEMEYGIEYDPYYDDPYTEDELPRDMKFKVDKKYGDRIYENGEIFYKDKQDGLFYRQGAKPKNLSFW